MADGVDRASGWGNGGLHRTGHGERVCGPWEAESSEGCRKGSAGVEIVQSDIPFWREGEGWRASGDPVLVVGSAGGGEEYALYRVGAVTRLPDGRIAAANRGTSQVRLYDRAGTHVMDIGGSGDGPGEFRTLSGVWAYGSDSILVSDGPTGRFTVFSDDGNALRTIPITPGDGARQAYGVGPAGDGTLLVAAVADAPGGRREGLFEGPSLRFQHFGPEGTQLGTITQQAGGSRWALRSGGNRPSPWRPFPCSSRSTGQTRSSCSSDPANNRRSNNGAWVARSIAW